MEIRLDLHTDKSTTYAVQQDMYDRTHAHTQLINKSDIAITNAYIYMCVGDLIVDGVVSTYWSFRVVHGF